MNIFNYVELLDCFVINPEYQVIADELGLTEWSPVVWIGRYFTLDNDYGEHWFDNWELRVQREQKAIDLGLETSELFIIDPDRFKDNADGPCHSYEGRKKFWTDVLKSFELSLDTIVFEAKRVNKERELNGDGELISGLTERITLISAISNVK